MLWTCSDEPFRQGTQREYGEVGECGDDDRDAGEQARELRACRSGSVPAVDGTTSCSASDPASASTSTIGTNRPSSIATPSAVLSHGVLAVSPANAEPLLFAAEVKA